MSTDSTKSAIKEARDQLFVDTADGARLTTVSDNLGFSRPTFGFGDDDIWRALVGNLAVGPRQTEQAFRKTLEVCIGPAYLRSGVISDTVLVGATTIELEDASDLTQVGTLIMSPGQAGEESLGYCFVDYEDNVVYLESPTSVSHVPTASGSAVLSTDAVIGATALVMYDSSTLPVSYPYTIVLDKGTVLEETVTVSDNNTTTNTLTVSATVNAHEGFKADYVRRTTLNSTLAGRTFLSFDVQDTIDLPESGWIRLEANTGSEEVVFYDENSADEDILYLKTPLVSPHAALSSVELVRAGASVETVSVVQLGRHWEVHHTTHDNVKILIPSEDSGFRILDAAFLHDAVPDPLGSSTLAVGTTAADTVIELVSVADFPDEAGMLTINGTERFFYTLRDEDALPNPTLTLTQPIGAIYAIGTTVELFEVPYAGTDLEEGNPRDAVGAAIDDRFPGPYVFDTAQRSPGTVSTTLTSFHPAPTYIINDVLVGRETLECPDLSSWAGIITPFQAKVGVSTGFEEDLTAVKVVLTTDSTLSVVGSGGGIGTTEIVVDATATLSVADAFPQTVGTNTASFQIVIDAGGPNEEFATVVNEEFLTPNYTFTILEAWTDPASKSPTFTVSHAAPETVSLVNDVLTVDPTTRQHFGPSGSPTVAGHPVGYLTDTISLSSSIGLPQVGGEIYINFGAERHSYRSQLIDKPAATEYEFEDTSGFPTVNFPYQIVLSAGTNIEESANVVANNTVLNRLTFSAAPLYTHTESGSPLRTQFGGYASFVTGGEELIEYQDVDGNDLILNPAQVISKHTIGESVLGAVGSGVPRVDGFSYPFYLPPDRYKCLKDMFERVRAAGIQVTIIPL
jgi:hypothetical protein